MKLYLLTRFIICATASAICSQKSTLVLDVDGTLYDKDCEIEQQVRNNYETFARDTLCVDKEACKILRRKFGTTIRGLSILRNSKSVFRGFYETVYPGVNMEKLRKYSTQSTQANGYRLSRTALAHDALFKISERFPILVASNAPTFHVQRVLARIGLAGLQVNEYFTPDALNFTTKHDVAFWHALKEKYPPERHHCLLIDDNQEVLQLAESMGIPGLKVSADRGLSECLVEFILNIRYSNCKLMREFRFDDNKYLSAKNEIDFTSVNKDALKQLLKALERRRTCDSSLIILDLGSGHLNMLSILVEHCKHMHVIPASVHYIAAESNQKVLPYAYRSLTQLGLIEKKRTEELVRRFTGEIEGISMTVDVCEIDYMSAEAVDVLRSRILPTSHAAPPTPPAGFDLIVGACMADLHNPKQLLHQVIELASDAGGLLYLPLTFNGSTALSLGGSADLDSLKLPALYRWPTVGENEEGGSDSVELVINKYHAHLQSLGHSLSTQSLLQQLQNHGCKLVCEPLASNWNISKQQHPYLWCSLLHFIMQGTTFDFVETHDIRTWWSEVLDCSNRGTLAIEVENIDILAELPKIEMKIGQDCSSPPPVLLPCRAPTAVPERGHVNTKRLRHSVVFTAAREISVVEEAIPTLGPLDVRIRTVCTLVSSGSELKVFRGDLACAAEEGGGDVALDETLKALQGNMRYPLRYGYSLVGVVEAVGSELSHAAERWLGKRVFAFAPHSTVAVVPAADVLVIPNDINDFDAVFLPSMETAACLLMSAQPMLGEHLAVVGQGLIGQLTAAAARVSSPLSQLTLVDVRSNRLQQARLFVEQVAQHGALVGVWNPLRTSSTQQPLASPGGGDSKFDVCIEISGSMSGLQSAVDNTLPGGRIVMGSWYDTSTSPDCSKPAALRLNTRFHRSGISLQACQVSRIPGALRERWSKARRFDVAWDLIRQVRPSRMLMMSGCGCSSAGHAAPPVGPVAAVSRFPLVDQAALQRMYEQLENGIILTALLYNE